MEGQRRRTPPPASAGRIALATDRALRLDPGAVTPTSRSPGCRRVKGGLTLGTQNQRQELASVAPPHGAGVRAENASERRGPGLEPGVAAVTAEVWHLAKLRSSRPGSGNENPHRPGKMSWNSTRKAHGTGGGAP